MLTVNNRNTRTRSEICSKLTIKTLERRQWRLSQKTYFTPCSSVSIANFEDVIVALSKSYGCSSVYIIIGIYYITLLFLLFVLQ